MNRQQITDDAVNRGIDRLIHDIHKAIKKNGRGAFVSKHEILGQITEEYHELIEAVHAGTSANVQLELMDIALAAVFAWVCIEEEGKLPGYLQ